ncbi:MAG: YbaN family protein [Pseudomonadales bacterium]|nr:YbaN family protein [Pseudomonadales bacterium]
MEMVRVLCWRSLAILCVALGMIGVIVPGLPTVPFLLVAAWAGTRGWPRLEQWLLNHPRYGASIRQWREHGAVSRRAKCAASTMMLISIILIALSGAHNVIKIAVPLFLCGTLLWLWRRPEPRG